MAVGENDRARTCQLRVAAGQQSATKKVSWSVSKLLDTICMIKLNHGWKPQAIFEKENVGA